MPNQIDFRLRYQVREDTPHGTLLKYLKSKETEFQERQMVLAALSAFWYPQARQWADRLSEDRLQAIARLSIYELRQQIRYLAYTFGLEKELAEAGPSYPMEPNSVSVAPDQFMAAPIQSNGFDNDQGPESSSEVPELLHHSDDELLNQIISG